MKLEKRKLYNIKGMKKQGLNYFERGLKINFIKRMFYPTISPKVEDKPTPLGKLDIKVTPVGQDKPAGEYISKKQRLWSRVYRFLEIYWIKLNRPLW